MRERKRCFKQYILLSYKYIRARTRGRVCVCVFSLPLSLSQCRKVPCGENPKLPLSLSQCRKVPCGENPKLSLSAEVNSLSDCSSTEQQCIHVPRLLGSFSSPICFRFECCFTSTETVGLLGTGAQDGHLAFHTAPELCRLQVPRSL